MTQQEKENKIQELKNQLAKETEQNERKKLYSRIWKLNHYEQERERKRNYNKQYYKINAEKEKIRGREKRLKIAEQKAKSISILKSRTAFELAYTKKTKEELKKFYSTNYYLSYSAKHT